MFRRHLYGGSYRAIAAEHGLTPAWVRKIVMRVSDRTHQWVLDWSVYDTKSSAACSSEMKSERLEELKRLWGYTDREYEIMERQRSASLARWRVL